MHEFRLADIGEGLEEAEIIAWRVAVGDRVERDQPIVEVMTDKSNAELPSPVTGTITSLGGGIGDLVTVGELIATIEPEAGDAPDGADPGTTEAAAADPAIDRSTSTGTDEPVASTFRTASATQPSEPSYDAAGAPRRAKASPSTRAEALRRGIDLSTIAGSGPGGRILLGDLDAGSRPATGAAPGATQSAQPEGQEPQLAAAPQAPAPTNATQPAVSAAPAPSLPEPQPVSSPAAGVEPLRGVRRAIARNMAQTWSTIPHIHAFDHIDAQPLIDMRSQLRASSRPEFADIRPLAFFVAAVATTMRSHPLANATLDLEAETITRHPRVNIGVAVASPTGLTVPVVRDADRLDLATLSAQLDALVSAARAGELSAEAHRGGTVTVTNFGSLGGEQALPLIRHPESVIFGFGDIRRRPFVVGDEVVARSTMHLVVGTDHRLLDGDVTTAMLRQVADLLTAPIDLVLGP